MSQQLSNNKRRTQHPAVNSPASVMLLPTSSNFSTSVPAMRMLAIATFLLLSVLTVACSGLSAMQPARDGQHAEMRIALHEDMRHGRLDRKAVASLARIVAEREIREAKDGEAVRQVLRARARARELENVFERRAKQNDPAAPHAAMALLDVGRGNPSKWRSHINSTDPGWRAVAVRTLTGKKNGDARRKGMLDHNQQVRRAAVRAAEDAADLADREVLLDTAQHDPDNVVRVTALRAFAAIATEPDVQTMRDMWSMADSPIRQGLVNAWAHPKVLELGGLRHVMWVAETQTGIPSIIAGGVLLRLGGETKGVGSAALYKGAQDGSAHDRAFAIAMAPIEAPGWVELLEKLSEDAEPTVRIAALEKLASHPKTAASAKEKLEKIAVADLPESFDAKQAMARVRDQRAATLLLADANSSKLDVRESAMKAYVALEEYARAAFFLSDRDARLRMTAACTLLMALSRR